MKTNITKELERELFKEKVGKRDYICPEVTIGIGGNRRVDFLSLDSKGIIKCYEVKVSKEDFKKKSGHTFVGHLNYYVMPKELYEEVKDEIPNHVGVIDGVYSLKKAKKQKLDEKKINMLKDSLIRSMARVTQKSILADDVDIMKEKDRKISKLYRDLENTRNKIYKYQQKCWELEEKVHKVTEEGSCGR